MTIQERASKVLQEIDAELALAEKATLARHQPCGCVVCICKNEEQCQGCGASNCGTHPAGQIPNPVYEITSRTGWPTALRCLNTAIERLLVISRYDANSRFGTGICQFGCDTPNIAQTTLAIICDQWESK